VPAADGRSLSAQTREGNRAGFGQHGALGAWPQEGRHFSGYYGDYCYLPLYIVVGDVVLWAQLRTSDHGGDEGWCPRLRKSWQRSVSACRACASSLRGGQRIGRDEIMTWCEGQRGVFYCLGLSKNAALIARLGPALGEARARRCLCGAPACASSRVLSIGPGKAGAVPTGDRQSRSDGRRRKSPFHRHEPAGRRLQSREGPGAL